MNQKLLRIGLALLITAAIGCNSSSNTTPAASPTDAATFKPLLGQWIRPDGGYMLMIHKIEPDGKATVSYYNPNPIRVSEAQATQQEGALKLFVELRDAGYPGCTYRLTYNKTKDQLVGVYFQAAQQQSYDIYFERGR